MKKILSAIVIAILISPAMSQAAWVTVHSKIDKIITYADRDYILITIEDTSFTIPEPCNTRTIAISPNVPENRRNQILSTLLSAQAQKAEVSLTFSDSSCVAWTSGDTQYLKLIKIKI